MATTKTKEYRIEKNTQTLMERTIKKKELCRYLFLVKNKYNSVMGDNSGNEKCSVKQNKFIY